MNVVRPYEYEIKRQGEDWKPYEFLGLPLKAPKDVRDLFETRGAPQALKVKITYETGDVISIRRKT